MGVSGSDRNGVMKETDTEEILSNFLLLFYSIFIFIPTFRVNTLHKYNISKLYVHQNLF